MLSLTKFIKILVNVKMVRTRIYEMFIILIFILKILSNVRSLCYDRSDVVEGNVYIIGAFPAKIGSLTEKHQDMFPNVLLKCINENNQLNKQTNYDLSIGYTIYYHTNCSNNSNDQFLSDIFQSFSSSNSSKIKKNNTIAMFISGLKKNTEDEIISNITTIPIFIFRKNIPTLSYPSQNIYSQAANIHPIFPKIVQEIKLFVSMLKHFKIENINIISTTNLYDKIIEKHFLPLLIENKRCFYYIKSNQTKNRIQSFFMKKNHSYTFLFGDNYEQVRNVLKLRVRTIFIGNQAWTHSLEQINITSPLQIMRPQKEIKPSPIATQILETLQQFQNLDDENILLGKDLLQAYLNTIDLAMKSLKKATNLTFLHKTNSFTNQEIIHRTHFLINQNITSSMFPNRISLITINTTLFREDTFYSLAKNEIFTNKKPIQTSSFKESCSKIICKFNYKNVYQSNTMMDNASITSHRYSCQKCRNIDNNLSQCQRHYEHVPYYTSLAYVVYTVMSVGVLTTATACMIFLVYKKTPYVKASHQFMSLVQLFAHFLLFLAPAMFIGKPSQTLCALRPITFGILFTFIMAMIVTKTQKLNFIFQSRLRVSKRQVQMSQKMEISLILIMMLIQFCIAGLSYFMSPSRILIVYNKALQSYIVRCNTDEELMIQMTFGFLLEIMCMIQAFKARNLPENFNETKHIFIAMILCIMTEAIGLLLRYYVIKKNINKALIDALILILMNCILLVIMYGHKCYVIVFRPHLNTPSAFKQNLQLHNLKGIVPDHVTVSHRDSTFSRITTISPLSIRTTVFSADNMAYKQ